MTSKTKYLQAKLNCEKQTLKIKNEQKYVIP